MESLLYRMDLKTYKKNLSNARPFGISKQQSLLYQSGLVGLAISYALSITGLLSGLVKFFTETEKEMVSVERVLEYIERTPKENDSNQHVSVAFSFINTT